MPGPPPNPNRRRRNAKIPGAQLPASGRPGPPPEWPLPGRPLKSEAALWADLWSTPQAVMWERLGWTRVVGRYTRLAIASEKRDAPTNLAAEVRQLEDRLGLSPMAMRRLEWTVVEGEEDAAGAEVANLDDFRARLG